MESCVKLTIVLVTEVPMFDPMIIGTAVLTGTSVATRPTMMVVEVEEDWTRTVTSTPIMTPTTGLFRRVESAKNAKIKESDNFYPYYNPQVSVTHPNLEVYQVGLLVVLYVSSLEKLKMSG